MLRELHISNLAVIAEARIELHEGLNCFTGATGAGKSLVIGALEVLLGLRSPSEMLRPGAEEGRVSGVFDVADPTLLQSVAEAADADLGDGGNELLVTRRLYASGRSSVSLNGNPITLSMLKSIAELLVDVHGQHDHQFLLRPSNQLDVLDAFGDLQALRQTYREIYQQLAETLERKRTLSASEQLRRQQLELYSFQAEEIDQASPDPGEYTELQARSAVLKNLERLRRDAGASHQALYESDGSVVERLRAISGILGESAQLDEKLAAIHVAVRDATIQLEEAAFDLSRYLDRLEIDPGELTEVEDRLNTINRVLSKYGDSVEAVLDYRAEIGRKIDSLKKDASDFGELDRRIAPLIQQLADAGKRLTSSRKQAADRLAPLIEKQLAEVGMEKARFTIVLARSGESALVLPGGSEALRGASASGLDTVEFMIQTNPGLPAQPLRRIASGGEMSRIMLALKSILAASDRVSVLVFDEIDSNVGGRLGSIIGSKLRQLGQHHQVLCITHLPQIACFADRHLTVRKEVSGDTTATTVRTVSGDERLHELAEMIGGEQITATTLAQVRELLSAADPANRPTRSPAIPVKSAAAKRASARRK